VPLRAIVLAAFWLGVAAQNPAPQDQGVLTGLSPEEMRLQMESFTRALGVECTHCHVAERWTDESKPAFATARNMIRMVREINGRLLADVGKVTCWSCHGGQVAPSRFPSAELDKRLAEWPSGVPETRKMAMTVYAVTLGVTCEHCHVTGDWAKAEKTPMKLVARMTAMFDEFPKYMPATARTQCWMCHKGARTPKTEPAPGR